MKTLLLLILVAVVAFLAGCRTRPVPSAAMPAQRHDENLLQKALRASIPVGHTGYARFHWHGRYLTITGEGDGFRQRDDGSWLFDWLTYRRELTVPIAPGLDYNNGAEITLGRKP